MAVWCVAALLCSAVAASSVERLAARCSFAEQQVLVCLNTSHYAFQSCKSGRVNNASACRHGFACSMSTGACAADDIATHLLRSVDYQIVETKDTKEATTCRSPREDAADGKMLCEVMHATAAIQPTFGHSLGNTWETAPVSQHGIIDSCNFTTAQGWRECIGANVGRQAALLTARSPHLLISAGETEILPYDFQSCATLGLMEFLAQSNLDDSSQANFEKCCKKGTIGQWGPKSVGTYLIWREQYNTVTHISYGEKCSYL